LADTTPETPTIRVLTSLSEIDRKAWDGLANPGWTLADNGRLTRAPETCDGPSQEVQDTAENASDARALADHPESDPDQPESPSQHADSKPQEIPFNPFITHDFLWSLEETSCSVPRTGWAPCHLALEDANDGICGLVPAYLKNHSQGEYVFDHGWADAFERAGGRYYPKLQISVPFTPATGRRLLLKPGPDWEHRAALLAAGIRQAAEKFDASSAHLTFLPEDEAGFLEDQHFLHRTDQQFHWANAGYGSFEDFLDALSARKRKTIRRERRDAAASGLTFEWVTGADITEDHWDAFFHFYMDTGSRKWGRPYLNRPFFSVVGERMAERILLVLARRGGRIIAGALNFIGSDTLYGRYWGAIEHLPFLHFEVCYYQAIDFAIAHGLAYVEAGAQGTHKLARGYLPVTTHSAHFIVHPGLRDAVARYLDQEREAVAEENEMLRQMAPFRRG